MKLNTCNLLLARFLVGRGGQLQSRHRESDLTFREKRSGDSGHVPPDSRDGEDAGPGDRGGQEDLHSSDTTHRICRGGDTTILVAPHTQVGHRRAQPASRETRADVGQSMAHRDSAQPSGTGRSTAHELVESGLRARWAVADRCPALGSGRDRPSDVSCSVLVALGLMGVNVSL